MFVIFKNGGKQYKVQAGDIIKLENQGIEKGQKISLKNIIACKHDNKDLIGKPYLDNIEVKAEVLENKKNKKVLVFKKRRRHNSRRLNGHRQLITVVKVNEILMDGKSLLPAKNKTTPSKKSTNKKKVSLKPDTKKGVTDGS